MSYVCIQSERTLWTVGFYDPDGEWQPESDHSTPDGALARVAYLNGGGDALELRGAIQQLKEQVRGLQQEVARLKGEDDPYMPTDEEWRARLGMIWAATNTDGDMWLHSRTPSDANEHSWRGSDDWFDKAFVKQVTPPEDFRTTLRYRPAHL